MNRVNIYTATDDLETVAPVSQDSDLAIDGDNLIWVNGDGYQRIVIGSRYPITFVPFDSITYLTNFYVSETEKVIFRGKGNSVDISNFNFTYYRVYAFNGVASNEKYNRETSDLNLNLLTADNTEITVDSDIITADQTIN